MCFFTANQVTSANNVLANTMKPVDTNASPIPTSGETIAPIKKGKKPATADALPAYLRSIAMARLDTPGASTP